MDSDGLEVLREVQRTSPNTLTITLTGYASLDTALRALREGAYDYLIKPCDVLELRTTVKRGLERSRMAAQLRRRLDELEQANETIRGRTSSSNSASNVPRPTCASRSPRATTSWRRSTHSVKSPLTFIKGMANVRRRRAVENA